MNIQKLSSLIQGTAKQLHNSEKLPLPLLAVKARKAAESRPMDIPIVSTAQVLTKMASNQTFISRSEFAEVLNSFKTPSSKLADVFAEELGQNELDKPKLFQRDSNEGMSLDRDYDRLADPVLANALSGAFSETREAKLYSNAEAEKAHKSCYAQLLSVGLPSRSITTFAGRNDIIICQASYESPKGQAHVLVPVEIKEGKALLPSMFLTRFGFREITKENVAAHVFDVAGKSFKVDGENLLNVIAEAKHGVRKVASDVEMAAIKLASEKGRAALDPSHVVYAELDTDKPAGVQLPQIPLTQEEDTFASKLSNPDGVARFVHGDKLVEAARHMLVSKLAGMSYRNVQVKVADVEDKKIFFNVAIGTHTGLKVPVDIKGGNAMPPKVVIADGQIKGFSATAINDFVQSGHGGDKRALAAASPTYDMKPTELLDVVKQSVAEGNYLRAEEAINVLGEIDTSAQQVALAHFMSNIYEPGKEPSKQIKVAASKPVQDLPVTFMTHKIFFPEGE